MPIGEWRGEAGQCFDECVQVEARFGQGSGGGPEGDGPSRTPKEGGEELQVHDDARELDLHVDFRETAESITT